MKISVHITITMINKSSKLQYAASFDANDI